MIFRKSLYTKFEYTEKNSYGLILLHKKKEKYRKNSVSCWSFNDLDECIVESIYTLVTSVLLIKKIKNKFNLKNEKFKKFKTILLKSLG